MRGWRWLVLGSALLLGLHGVVFGACSSQEWLDELTNDPANLGYAPYVSAGRTKDLVPILSLVRNGAGYAVSKGAVSRDDAIGTWFDVISLIQGISNEILKNQWVWNTQILFGLRSTIDYSASQAQLFFAQMIADHLQVSDGEGGTRDITSDDITAKITRQGSRAEVVCGTGTIPSVADLDTALNP